MTAHFKHTTLIDRPVAAVFDFHARNHVKNHNRWDPDIELWLDEDAPLEVGTIIRRRNSRSGTPVEGTMEVTEFEPDKAMGMLIHDGPAVMTGRVTYEAINENQTRMTTYIEIPGMDDSMDKSFLNSRLERSGENQKQLIESEM